MRDTHSLSRLEFLLNINPTAKVAGVGKNVLSYTGVYIKELFHEHALDMR